MALGQFQLKARGKASSYDPRVHAGKPLIVVPREFRANFTTPRFPNPKDVVIVDVVDLLADTVLISVIWGGGAMVDAIKEKVPGPGETPEKLPVKISTTSSAAGNQYYILVPLEGRELEFAAAWDQKFPTRIDQERAAHEAAQGGFAGGAPAADPMAAAMAALQGGGAVAQPTPLAQAAGVGMTPQDNQLAQVAALQAQLAALQGGQTTAAPQEAAPAAPTMSDADLEAAIAALK